MNGGWSPKSVIVLKSSLYEASSLREILEKEDKSGKFRMLEHWDKFTTFFLCLRVGMK